VTTRLCTFLIGLILSITVASTTSVLAQESSADFFRKDREYWSKGLKAPAIETYKNDIPRQTHQIDNQKQAVADEVAKTAQYRLGSEWVDTALKITKIESGFRCNAVGPRVHGGRARGAMQVMPGTARALGYAPNELTTCEVGIEAGIAHMRRCLDAGVKTPTQMAACHVAGWGGWNTKLRKKSEMYKHQYVRMVMAAR